MFDSLKEIANQRLKRKKERKEAEKFRKDGDMLNPRKYEESMGLRELMKTRKEDDDEDEEY